eukprot:CAMPEP_0168544826 /NCGR_PEP_ID=MMETSP0413-20121227/2629_1 /TAXON_ID=136452 /ORGANISM="Filamoeba nolandi, Strain NC-AS-23-1" /LENGTH=153 /DNA_ID=CAMNT_0008574877 /DNA_START=84 /DNA_END=545 /DNA_ORIENTATION=-
MVRVKDINKSMHFYQDLLGMRLCQRLDFEWGKFSLYFFAYVPQEIQIPEDPVEKAKWCFSWPGSFVELTHNWGTESDPNFAGYHNGNKEPRGFGHLAIMVPDVYKCVERLEKEGVKIAKRPDDGKMKGFAFVEDPDGYWIEVLKDGDSNGVCC